MTKQRLLNAITAHSRIVVISASLAITVIVGTLVGSVDMGPHAAFAFPPDPA